MKSEKFSTEAVNCLCRLDMKYTIVSDEFDEMLGKLKAMDDHTKGLEKVIKRNVDSAKFILRRFKLTDGAKEELDEIIRLSELILGE